MSDDDDCSTSRRDYGVRPEWGYGGGRGGADKEECEATAEAEEQSGAEGCGWYKAEGCAEAEAEGMEPDRFILI